LQRPSGGDSNSALFAAGDYFTWNSRLYFILDYDIGGFIVENCQTLCSLPISRELMEEGATWIARDRAHRKMVINTPVEEEPEDD
jgi:hypothetical protein